MVGREKCLEFQGNLAVKWGREVGSRGASFRELKLCSFKASKARKPCDQEQVFAPGLDGGNNLPAHNNNKKQIK